MTKLLPRNLDIAEASKCDLTYAPSVITHE